MRGKDEPPAPPAHSATPLRPLSPIARELAPGLTPIDACERLRGLPHLLLLDAAGAPGPRGRHSFVAADPVLVVRDRGGRVEIERRGAKPAPVPGTLFDALRHELAAIGVPAPTADLPPFQGGFAGYVTYEAGARLAGGPARSPGTVPDAELALYDWVAAWDHETGRAWLVSTGAGAAPGEDPSARAALRMDEAMRALGAEARDVVPHECVVPDEISLPHDSESADSVAGGIPAPSLDDAGYEAAVERIREYIAAGDVFQVNVTRRLAARLPGDAWSLYRRLRARTAAPFSAFLEFGDTTIASASPERFLCATADGIVEACPIKGTRPRGATPADDARLAAELRSSEKDRAENVMIADLLRNDLSRVCRPRTVRATALAELESFPTVHHLVSRVRGELADGEDAVSAWAAAFPSGSITGAPKVRAMEIVAELEPAPRGIYCGLVGYLSLTGAMDSSVAIRTVTVQDGIASWAAGGGITLDSVPAEELDEANLKAAALERAVRGE